MRTSSTNATSARPTAPLGRRGPAGRCARHRALGIGVLAVTLLVVTGCRQAAPTTSLAGCPGGECATGPAQAMSVTNRASPPAARDQPASPAAAGDGADATPPAAQFPATPVAYDAESAVLGPVTWTTGIAPESNAPLDAVTSFPASAQSLYATIPAQHLAAGTTVTAEWSYNRTPLDSFDQVLVAETTVTDVWLEFHLSRSQPGAWPAGTYVVSIAVNDQPAVTGTVDVWEPA